MNSKKGVIEVQFNWVFILIAGVLILLFFGSIVLKLKSNSDTTISNTILTNMQTIMAGAEVSSNTVTPISIPDTKIEVSCDSISVGSITSDITKNKIVFAPEIIEGRTMLTWSLPWGFPYHISNFLYMTTPNFKYIIVDSTKGKEIYYKLPQGLTKQLVDKNSLSDLSNSGHKLAFVFFNDPEPDQASLPYFLENMKDNEVIAINIDSGNNKISFYQYKKSLKNFEYFSDAPYLGDEMIIGAMFSGDAKNYICNLEKALKKMEIVSMVYAERTEELQRIFHSNPSCFYTITPFEIDYSLNNIDAIIDSKRDLEIRNENLQKASCPTLY
ncbi:MAG: hypothetical protein PHV16_03510 [Candidatus Nanoarchaeia archaeon]|nr:hypothetical protein [Candidatus Nanoarchaeia archaeon]